MSKLKESSIVAMENSFQSIINKSLINESKEVKEPVVDKVKDKKIQEESTEIDESPKLGSKFNQIFDSIFKDTIEEDYDEMEGDDLTFSDEGGDDYAEDEMVSVPSSVIKELYAYLEDSMGAEDNVNLDSSGVNLEEAYNGGEDMDGTGKPMTAKNKMNNHTQTGSKTVNDSLGTKGVGKTGDACGKKDRDGKPHELYNLLKNYMQTGSWKAGHKLKVGDKVVNK